MERQINEFNFTIGGQIEQIEVHSLASTLLNLNDAVQIINSELATNKKIELTIKTYKPGSFDIHLAILADMTAIGAASGIFTAQNLETAKQLIETFTSILSIKKFLRGSKPKEIKKAGRDMVEITSNTGTVMIVNELTLNISMNDKVDENIIKMVTTLGKIPYVDSLAIKDKDEKDLFKAVKLENDFRNLIAPNPAKVEEQEELLDKFINDAILSVYAIVFNDTTKWQFFYEGNKIPVSLRDSEFIEKVMGREIQFANGDRLQCNLTIHQKFNPVAHVYENKNYTITKVIAVLPPEPQGSLKFG